MTAPERVFDGDLLLARLWRPDRPTTALYVTFRQWVPAPGTFDNRGCVQRAPLVFGGHPGTAALDQAGGFRALQRLSFSARLQARAVVALHRELRSTSLRYWSERAEQLLRQNRPALAAAALDRAEALAPAGRDEAPSA